MSTPRKEKNATDTPANQGRHEAQYTKRRRNVRAALERIIEKAREVEASATAIVGAISAYAKINASGQWVERSECVNLNELFNRMSIEEMDAYAKSGTLPTWFDAAMDATASDSGRGSNEQ